MARCLLAVCDVVIGAVLGLCLVVILALFLVLTLPANARWIGSQFRDGVIIGWRTIRDELDTSDPRD